MISLSLECYVFKFFYPVDIHGDFPILNICKQERKSNNACEEVFFKNRLVVRQGHRHLSEGEVPPPQFSLTQKKRTIVFYVSF